MSILIYRRDVIVLPILFAPNVLKLVLRVGVKKTLKTESKVFEGIVTM